MDLNVLSISESLEISLVLKWKILWNIFKFVFNHWFSIYQL